MKYRIKRFSSVLNTSGTSGFDKKRKYDQDLNRLSRGETSRELANPGSQFQKMKKKLKEELEEAKKMMLWELYILYVENYIMMH